MIKVDLNVNENIESVNLDVDSRFVVKEMKNPIINLELENAIRTTQTVTTVTADVLDYEDGRISNKTISVPQFETKYGVTLAVYEYTVNGKDIYSFTFRGSDAGGNISFSNMVNCTKVSNQLKVIVTDPTKNASLKIKFAKGVM